MLLAREAGVWSKGIAEVDLGDWMEWDADSLRAGLASKGPDDICRQGISYIRSASTSTIDKYC